MNKSKVVYTEHKWTKEDAIITLFYNLYGTKGLLITDEKDLAECVIGSTLASLKMMSFNFNHIMGIQPSLANVSAPQTEVYNEYYKKCTYEELRDIVNNIIDSRDLVEIEAYFKEYHRILEIKSINRKAAKTAQSLAKELAKKRQQEDDAMWRRLGKDPNKMRKLVS